MKVLRFLCAPSSRWSALSGLLMAVAWLTPGSELCALLGWCSCFALVLATRHSGAGYKNIYLAGIIQNSLGFYWLYNTLALFGGFAWPLAAALFALFVLVSSLQNVCYLLLYRAIPSSLDRFGFRCAAAWVTTEFLLPRVFPWYIGHTQIGFDYLAQAADLAGVLLLSFLMLWGAEAVLSLAKHGLRHSSRAITPAALALILTLSYGAWRQHALSVATGQALDVALVQANINVLQVGDLHYFEKNKERYEALSASLPEEPLVVVWPESVVQDFVFDGLRDAKLDSRIPSLPGKTLITGALTFRSKKEFYNSALAILPDQRLSPPYHKRVLMPFGEYVPGASIFPALAEFLPAESIFQPGSELGLWTLTNPATANPQSFIAAPLICYEDVLPQLARDAARNGAGILINLANDAWFGNTVAPRQHHMIASFRAIETRRYLLRSTNSGLTAVVDARGHTLGELKPYSEGILRARVAILDEQSPVVQTVGDVPWWALSILTGFSLLDFLGRLIRKRPSAG